MWTVFGFLTHVFLISSVATDCPVDICEWFPWKPWGSCSSSCGGGYKIRSRSLCCTAPVDIVQCKKDCNAISDDFHEYDSCNNICYHGRFHFEKTSRWSYGRCICTSGYRGDCCDIDINECYSNPCRNGATCRDLINRYRCTCAAGWKGTNCENELCGWNGKWCWPGSCGYGNYESSCSCSYGFTRQRSGGKTMCQPVVKPTLQVCRAGIESRYGDAVNTTTTGKCSQAQSVYTNLQPYKLSFTIASSFSISVNAAASANRIRVYMLGIVGSRIDVSRKNIQGYSWKVSVKDFGPGCSSVFSDRQPRTFSECTGSLFPWQTLNNGESICVNFIPYGGGYLTSYDYTTEIYRRTHTSKELCFMYDNKAPIHCTGSSSCSSSMLHLSHRITSNPDIYATFSSWTDPVPSGGSSSKASGIKKIVASLLRVEESDKSRLIMKHGELSKTELPPYGNKVHFTLPTEPALYTVLLEVHDNAGNVGMARRFVLYDKTSKVAVSQNNVLRSTTASAKTNYTWQVYHGSTCLNWTGRYYNTYHVHMNLLRQIKSDPHILNSYDQTDGVFPVSGTSNIDGIVKFEYTWKLNNGEFGAYSAVSDIHSQSFCEYLSLKDGQTYTFKIKPTDINLRFLTEDLIIHIDRSPPYIDNIWLTKDGYKQLFVHNSSDLSKMSLQFESFDLHSGLYSVKWKLGTSIGAEDIGSGSTAVRRINGSCTDASCYCPKVGLCEMFLYTISLNKLVERKTNDGQHNRNYYFSIIVTNNARLVNVEHTEVLADDSPPERGIIQEGVVGSPDVDYTSEDEITVNWHGFIDHESGIKFYRVGLSDRCLTKGELERAKNISEDAVVIETTEEECRFKVLMDGYYVSSVAAYNNAMEPSKIVCSDGITKDSTIPSIKNVTLKHSKVMEVFFCDLLGPWHVRSDLRKVALLPTDICMKRCASDRHTFLSSLPELMMNYTENDIVNNICTNLPDITKGWFIYIPSNNIDISWFSFDTNSQIRIEEVGIASDMSAISSPDIESYKAIHGHSRYHNVHEGLDRGIPFYLMIRTTNKAGLETILPFGPVVIDDTPPRIKRELRISVDIHDDTIYCSWDNETFIDPEQTHAVDHVLFRIGAGDKFYTSRLKTASVPTCTSSKFLYCLNYSISKLQQQDEEKSLRFYFELNVYNMAGHFTTARSPTFVLPSQFQPSHGHVFDIDPHAINLEEFGMDEEVKDYDVHFSVGEVCASWKGFYHHRNLTFHVGVGTSEKKVDIVPFTFIENTKQLVCFNSSLLTPYNKYFVTVNAICSGGSKVVSSNGITIIEKEHIDKYVSIHIGRVCESASEYRFENYLDKNSSTTTFISGIPLKVGHGYTIKSNYGMNLDDVRSDDVLWMNDSNVYRNLFRRNFRAFMPVAIFTVSTKDRPEYELLNMTLLDCFENARAIEANDILQVSVSVHTNFSYLITQFKASVFIDDCAFDSLANKSCLQEMPQTEQVGTDRMFQIENVTLLEGETYRAGVSVCFRRNCLSPVYTSKFTVQSSLPSTNRISATAVTSKYNDTCFHVDVKWERFHCVTEMSFAKKYSWALSLDKYTDGLLTSWFPLMEDIDNKTIFNVQRCVDVPGYLHRPLYACIKAMCESGITTTVCTLIEIPHPNDYNKIHVYELDASNPFLGDITKSLHARFLGDTLPLLHTHDIDYCRKDTLMVGAIPNSDERNITWYLLTDQNIPGRSCKLSTNCVKKVSSTGGHVTLHKAKFIPGTKYYICATMYDETLEKVNICGNGFVIDDVLPDAGQVTILDQFQGYLMKPTEMIISWTGFRDKWSRTFSNITSSIYSYSYAIGSYPGGVDVTPFTRVGLSNTVKATNLHLQNGAKYYATIRAWDHVNFSVDGVSEPVGVDLTPPCVGNVTVGSALRHKYVVSTQNLHVHWNGFKDLESGIRHFYLGIGDEPGLDNVLAFREVRDQFVDLSRKGLHDGLPYFAVLKAVNQAGLWTTVSSDQFILDSSPPLTGVVRDGSNLMSSDMDYQNFTSFLSSHWEAFGDPHSGIAFYRVGLGTNPGQFDIHTKIEVGLRKEITWQGGLKAGVKYFTTVEACNGAGLCTSQHSDGIILDDSPPTPGKVHVGISSKHETYQSQGNIVSAQWFGFEDPQSYLQHFEWCITLKRNDCDILPFSNILLSQSAFKTELDLPLNKNIYIKIKAYNNAGQYSEAISDSFRVDSTAPLIELRPYFALENTHISHEVNTQWENSLIKLRWKFSDPDSPVVKHIVRLVTHHDGKVRRDFLQLGNENSVTIKMPENDLLLNGDRYWAIVTACNAAGLCTNSTSDELLIDSSPPHLGGFKSPMTWENEFNESRVTLTWYGFSDIESGIAKYMISVSKHYSGSDLSNGIIRVDSEGKYEQNCSILLKEQLWDEDTVILSIWAVNKAGLRSDIGKVTVTAVQTDTSGDKGILKLQKHSCFSHYCNMDCTCAVLGRKCDQSSKYMSCVAINNSLAYQSVHVLAGVNKYHQAITASSSCLTAQWIPEENKTKEQIQRYEWSIGIDKAGDGVFEGPYTKKWFDVDLQTNMTFCMPDSLTLVHGENYTIFIKAWYSENDSMIFTSLPVTIDKTPPDIVRGKHIFVSTDDCSSALSFINNASYITLCWQNVFKDRFSGIQNYNVMAGTSPNGDDLIPVTDYGLQTKTVFEHLQMHPGTKYFFTIRAVNGVGLATSLSSNGIVLDEEPPFAGVVFNTDNHRNVHFHADSHSLSASWHGFGDHHSYIHHFSVWVTEIRSDRLVLMKENVGIETSSFFNEVSLQHGESYKVSVKAWDAAGYESTSVDSEVFTIDLTPPVGFKCKTFAQRVNICNSSFYLEDIQFTTSLQKDIFYMFVINVDSLEFLPSVEIAIGDYHIVAPMIEKGNRSKVAEVSFLSPYNGSSSVMVNFDTLLNNKTVCIRLLECANMDFENETFPIDVSQISPSLLTVCSRILDPESGIKSVNVGVGTSPGGFQVYPLSSIPVENHIVIEHSSPHGAELFVTAFAHNDAGLGAVFKGVSVIVDHTEPQIENMTAEINIYSHALANTNKKRLANITVNGSVRDKETGIKECLCFLESQWINGVLTLTGDSESISCVFYDLTVVHGVTLKPRIICINNVELVARETGPHLVPSFLPPSSANAHLSVEPYNEISYECFECYGEFNETIQSNRSVVQASWSGFYDAAGIHHYEYILQEGNKTIVKHSENIPRSTALLTDLDLNDGLIYTLSVEAVNVGGIHSSSVVKDFKVESRAPEVSGQLVKLHFGIDGSNIIEWGNVFIKQHEMVIIFEVNIGSREGFCDIINRMETMRTSAVLPETDHYSVWLSVCARYVTGSANCHYQILYIV